MPQSPIPHDTLMSMKIAMLESLVAELLIDRLLGSADPIGEALAYAERRKTIRSVGDPDADLIIEAVWTEFLDLVVGAVQKRARRQD
jgi:hypothetical protein